MASPADRPHVRLVRDHQDNGESDGAPELGEVYAHYAPYVAAVAYRLLGRDEEVDDVVQEVFVRALRALPGLRDPGALKGWLASITVRVVARQLRRRQARRFLRLEADYDYAAVPSADASPETAALLASVYGMMDELSPQPRVAWLLRHVEGQSLPEVAASCGCSLATAKRRISQAQVWLEGRLRHG